MKSNFVLPALATLLFLTSFGCSADPDIGLQLYSVRADMQKNPLITIEKVGEMGYDFVETAGYRNGKIYGMDPLDFKLLVEENGMIFKGAHAGIAIPDSGGWESLMPWWDECIAAHKVAGAEYIVQPFMGRSAYTSIEGLKDYCDYFNAVGEKCNEAGITFGYHNHAGEFKKLNGEVIYDYMLKNTDPDKVFFQLDIYWIYEGDSDPFAYFEEYPGRFKSFHLKDHEEIGASGEIDFIKVKEATSLAGAEYHVVEVESYNFEPLVSVDKSLQYLHEIGYTK